MIRCPRGPRRGTLRSSNVNGRFRLFGRATLLLWGTATDRVRHKTQKSGTVRFLVQHVRERKSKRSGADAGGSLFFINSGTGTFVGTEPSFFALFAPSAA